MNRSRGTAATLLLLVAFVAGGRASGPQVILQSTPAGMRATVRNFLGIAVDSDGVSKCGFATCMAAYHARNTATPGQRTMLDAILNRTERQKQRTLGYFTVHFDTTGPNAPSMLDALHHVLPGTSEEFVDSVLAIANSVYAYEVGTLGYQPPPSDGTVGGGPEYDIYIIDLGLEYGETTPETQLDSKQDGGTYTSYLTIDNDFIFVSPDSNRGLPALRVTIAHEFHHAIQMGNYGYWSSEVYFHEITSTWMETMMYPSITDYLNYLRASWGQFKNPSVPFTSNDLIMYSRAIWGIYLARTFGVDIMREIWEEIRNEGPLGANATVLARHGTNFPSAFSQWNVWNYYTAGRSRPDRYYPNGVIYPGIAATALDFSPMTTQETFDGVLPSLSSRYYEVSPSGDTAAIVVTNLDAASALSAIVPQRSYSLTLSNTPQNASYERVVAGCYYAMTYDDPNLWKSWVAAGGTSNASGMEEGVPFPNPFRNDGTSKLYIPAMGTSATLHIYDSAMNLVFERATQSGTMFGKPVFSWDGLTLRNQRASSGVYFFTLEYAGKTMQGKFVVLRKNP
ncbi:MAG: T9SS type A sorting domain-containing protein [Bacteroidota bacterium]